MLRVNFHKPVIGLLFRGKQKAASLTISFMMMAAFFVPPVHGNSLNEDSNGEIWARICTQMRVYEVNIVTGEIRYPLENENNPQDTPLNACHNLCSRREKPKHA